MRTCIALAGVTLLSLATTASGADLPSRKMPSPILAAPAFTWTGFYVGGNAGYISKETQVTTVGLNGAPTGPGTLFNTLSGARVPFSKFQRGGFTGGGQVGLNYQFSNVVVGLEADAAYTDAKRDFNSFGTTSAYSQYSSDLRYLATYRGRLGYAFDRMLVYATGGFAYGSVGNKALFFATPPAGGLGVVQFAGFRRSTQIGYAVGGGVEYALPANSFLTFVNYLNVFGASGGVSLKVEAFYYDLGRRNLLVGDFGFAPAAARGQFYNASIRTEGVVARAGVNFRFGGI